MVKIHKKDKQIQGLDCYKLPRFFPDWKPGEPHGYEDSGYPEQRKAINQEDIEQEIKSRVAEQEMKWQEMIQQAHDQGVQEGMITGQQTGRQEIAPAVELLQQWIRVLDAEKQEFFRNLEETLLKLGVFITEKIISREIRQDVKIVKNMVSLALTRVSHSGKIIIRVHPEDLQMVQSMSLNELLPHGISGDIEVKGDTKVDRGGCVIDTPAGIIDACIRTQLEELCSEVFGEETHNENRVQVDLKPDQLDNLEHETATPEHSESSNQTTSNATQSVATNENDEPHEQS
jgi:flagellar assembly protein FliH